MKVFKITSLCVFVFLSITAKGQEVKLETYKFGEGLNFSTNDGYPMRITGYLQPYMETKTYTDVDENSTQNRFRMRRIRLRFDGKLKNERFKYRFAFDLSGTSEAGDASTNNFLLDAFVSYDITNRIKATFGQRSTFTDNRELFMLSNTLQLVERSRVTSAIC
jgi:Phosphate-selective porin O and P.